ncbi:MAG: cell division protein FtsQ/DivIB [Planctomycetota bacterium]
MRACGRVCAVGLVVAAIAVGMSRLERHVHGHERFLERPRIVLPGVPDGLEEIIQQHVAPLTETAWIDRQLCERTALQLEESAWVRRVEHVRRLPSGRIEARCRYRTPAAMVQHRGEFVLVDAEHVRLPGRYPYSPGWLLIQGVAGSPPPAGEQWTAPGLTAATTISDRLADEPFADQVTAIRVHNFRGRLDSRAAHVELATDRAGGRIIWGSAPGEEIEENSAEQKLAILRRNHELYGRIDAGRPVIDVSTFPDRFTAPAGRQGAVAGARNPA